MKKIISFSIFGNKPMYTIGAIENARLQPDIYPGWICRFYVHSSVPIKIIYELEKLDCEIVYKDEPLVTKSYPGMFWRFEPLKDPSVNRFIVRDTDSRLSNREKICTDEWEKTGKEFIIIRDHPSGHNSRIMGGIWGATKRLRKKLDFDMAYTRFKFEYYDCLLPGVNYPVHKNGYNIYDDFDQQFLTKAIYPLIRKNCIIFDNYHHFSDEAVLKIPHRRTNKNYIGRIIHI